MVYMVFGNEPFLILILIPLEEIIPLSVVMGVARDLRSSSEVIAARCPSDIPATTLWSVSLCESVRVCLCVCGICVRRRIP